MSFCSFSVAFVLFEERSQSTPFELLLLCYLAAIYQLSVGISQLSSCFLFATSPLPLPAVKTNYPVRRLCQTLKVHSSGYYAWLAEPQSWVG
ncbi:hypothetical protein CXG53_24235 [Pseudomonas guariconensis]|uniref:Secreted protein n=1 Tax=Pseudomonas guariconensis TaxID=1288410 RepID=A0AAX0VRH6_9PSED|nr:hypothetical protein CXG49_24155 [Pseudomonas guariconensis]PLV21587.1 hypothetical protein CXG53_24235 [Pseudomonas guariconensis]PLV26721.1 hypothetical protein CXG51_24290 [Pseudomonas guariconensis]